MEKAFEARDEQIRFQELLPFYANGTLVAEDLAWFQRYVSLHPQSRAAVHAEQLWARHIQGAVDSMEVPAPEAEHMERVYARWQGQRQRPGWLRRVSQAWATPWRIPAVWVGAASAALLGQLAIIATLMVGSATAPMRGGLHTCQPEPLLRLTFRPNAAWHEVALLLRAQGWVLRDGPSENGHIWVALPTGQTLEAARQAANIHPFMESVEVSPAVEGCQ